MLLSWRRRRAARRAPKNRDGDDIRGVELTIPSHFKCPISLDLMKDPVTLSTGITYDRESIERWIQSGNGTCPITNQVLTTLGPIPNHAIRKMIQNWCVENRSYGIDRIPTPRIPVTSVEVSEIISKLAAARRRQDADGCLELVVKVKNLVAESERNRLCVVGSGTGKALSEAFEAFSEGSFGKNDGVLGEILSTLTMISPLDEEAKSPLGTFSSLNTMVGFLKHRDLSVRRNATLVMREVLSSDQDKIIASMEIDEAPESLFKLVKNPICPRTTKASLMIIYYMVAWLPSLENEVIRHRFIKLGLVSLLLEMLVDSEKGICERALAVLDGLLSCEEGREVAFGHDLAVPVLVKKLLRVSNLATEFSVSILWRLGKSEKRGEGVLVEALQVGAFQKILLVLQVGCGEKTKEKATELLKMLNVHRERLECIDSVDFKDLKRPF